MSGIAEKLDQVRAKIRSAARRAGRAASDVRLVLVTKTNPPERVREAIDAGQRDLGENKVQEGRHKAAALAGAPVRWSTTTGISRSCPS